MFGLASRNERHNGLAVTKWNGFTGLHRIQAAGGVISHCPSLFGLFWSAEADGSLPNKSKQQEKQRNDRQDVDQWSEGLVGLGELGQGLQGVGSHPGIH